MEDEFKYDVYGDLEEFNLRNALSEKNDLVKKLEEQCHKANNDIGALEKECKNLKKKCKNIEKSFWSLLETSKAEIKRKDAQLDALKKQRDDIAFRRINTSKEFVAKYPSERKVCFVDSDKKSCKKSVGEKKDHTNLNYNPFKHFEEHQFRERNKRSPVKSIDHKIYKSPTTKNRESRRHPKSPKRDIYFDKNKSNSTHRSRDIIDINSNERGKLLSRKIRSRSRSFNKSEQTMEIKINEAKRSKTSNKRTNDELNKSDENYYENGNAKKKRNNLQLGEENCYQIETIKIESRLDENKKTSEEIKINSSIKSCDKIKSGDTNLSKTRKQDQNEMYVTANKCNEPIQEDEKKNLKLESLKQNIKINEPFLKDITTENKSKNNKFPRTFEEILFDDMVSGRDALKLKSSSTENTPRKNYHDRSWIYDNLEEKNLESLTLAKKTVSEQLNISEDSSNKISIDKSQNKLNEQIDCSNSPYIQSFSKLELHPQILGIDNTTSKNLSENLDETLEEGALTIDESDEPYTCEDKQQVSNKLQQTNKIVESKVENVAMAEYIKKELEENENVVEKTDLILQSDIFKETYNNSSKLSKNNFKSNDLKTKLKPMDGNDTRSTSLKNTEPIKKTDSEKLETENKFKNDKIDDRQVNKDLVSLGDIIKNKSTGSDLPQKENRAFIGNSLMNYKIPKLKKSNNVKSGIKLSAIAKTATIDSNTVSISTSVTKDVAFDSNLVHENQTTLKLNLAKIQNPEIVSSAATSIINEMKNQKMQDENNCYKTMIQSPQTSESFKSVQTTPETSPEQLSHKETAEATAFLTENLLTPLKLNISTNSEHEDKAIFESITSTNREINEEQRQDTEQISIDELERRQSVDSHCHKNVGLENIDFLKENRDDESLIIETMIIKNKPTTETKKVQKTKDKSCNDSKKEVKTESIHLKNEQNKTFQNIKKIQSNLESRKVYQDYAKDNSFASSSSESVSIVNSCKKHKESDTKCNENNNLDLSDKVTEFTIFATRKNQKISTKRREFNKIKNVKTDNENDDLVPNDKLNSCASKSVENVQDTKNDCDSAVISEPPIQSNTIRKSSRIANKKAKSIIKSTSNNKADLQNEEVKKIESVSVTESQLSEKDEELFNCFFKSPFHSESMDSINISGKSDYSQQIEKDFEQMFSTPSPIPITEKTQGSDVENTISKENYNIKNSCLDKLDATDTEPDNTLNNSLNLESSLNETQQLLSNSSSTVSPLIKKFSTYSSEYELITNENVNENVNENNSNESVTWVITRRKIKKKKNKE